MRVMLSWSSGKDSAWTLHALRQSGARVAGLLTTFNESAGRVAMHAVRRDLVEAQAQAAGAPLVAVDLPSPCPNVEYEARMGAAIARMRADGVTHMAFGDLFLRDVREYRERMLEGSGIEPLFPIWSAPEKTPALAREMMRAGIGAVLTCVDPKQIPAELCGRAYDRAFLGDLPPTADPCGEKGEFHTFCHSGPMFSQPLFTDARLRAGETLTRGGFTFTDFAAEAV